MVAESESLTPRTVCLLLWTLLPCLAIWVGMQIMQSAVWSFALYHGLCLLPAIIWGRALWRQTLVWPSFKQLAIIFLVSVIFCGMAVLLYEILGKKMLSNDDVLALLKRIGYAKTLFIPISIYTVVVNPVVEELFWRGVVYNELDKLNAPFRSFGLVWSSLTYAAFHYTIFRLVLFPVYAEIGTIMLAFYGAILALVYRQTKSIITISLIHGLFTDLAAIVLVIDLLRNYPGIL